MLSLTKRPYQFNDYVGNENIIKEVKALTKKGFPEVMFLLGKTGGGKSTLANIVSMVINCKKPIDKETHLEPCRECASCKSVMQENFNLDIIFKKGSEMGKEEVLALEDIVSTSPMYSKKKIIILDEAQELSNKKAKGAVLNLLEKKRKNVHFIFCTMDDNAFDKAILDRGRSYRFKGFSNDEMLEYLFKVAEDYGKENNIEYPESFADGLCMIVENAYGSMRAGLQLLERCLDSNVFDPDKIESFLGIISEQTMINIVFKIINGQADIFQEIKEKDYNMSAIHKIGRSMLLNAMSKKLAGINARVANMNYLEELAEIFVSENNYSFDKDRFSFKLMKFMLDKRQTGQRSQFKKRG